MSIELLSTLHKDSCLRFSAYDVRIPMRVRAFSGVGDMPF